MRGRAMSNVYFARPVTLSGPSRRLTCVPRTVGLAGQLKGSVVLATLDSFHAGNGFEDTWECAAPADVPVEPLSYLLGRRARMLLEQAYARHDEARRAEAAHERVLIAEGLLHRMQYVAVS